MFSAANAPVAAFSAYRSSTGSVAGGATIVWDSERYDVNDDYNEANGFFTCPQDGYYFFSISLYSAPDVSVIILNHHLRDMYLPSTCFFRRITKLPWSSTTNRKVAPLQILLTLTKAPCRTSFRACPVNRSVLIFALHAHQSDVLC